MKKIALSGKYGNGKFTMVDDEDAARLEEMGVSLSLTSRGYVQFYHNGKTWGLHRFLIQPQKGLVVDHIDRNKLNNCKANLRNCTRSENLANLAPYRGKSRFKGVSFSKTSKKWQAYIGHKGKLLHLGYFEKETDAALAYNEKAKELFGQYAFLNDVGVAE